MPFTRAATIMFLQAAYSSLRPGDGKRWGNQWACERLGSTQTAETGRLVGAPELHDAPEAP